MNCYQVRDQISAYIEKELTLPQVTQFETHLSGCAACREAYEGVVSVIRTLGDSDRVTLTGRFDAALKRRLDKVTSRPVRRPNRFIHGGTILGFEPRYAVMSAAALVAIIFLSVNLFPGGETPSLNTPVPLSTRQSVSDPAPASGPEPGASSRADQFAGDPKGDTTGTMRETGKSRPDFEDRIQLVKDRP